MENKTSNDDIKTSEGRGEFSAEFTVRIPDEGSDVVRLRPLYECFLLIALEAAKARKLHLEAVILTFVSLAASTTLELDEGEHSGFADALDFIAADIRSGDAARRHRAITEDDELGPAQGTA